MKSGRRMSRAHALFALFVVFWIALAIASPRGAATQAAGETPVIFANAEQRFRPPSEKWFEQTQQALKAEVARLSRVMDSLSKSDANVWKSHLRWELLEQNLGPRSTVNLSELEVVRRWMYSNRPGLESPFFAPLRARMDAYLDAAFTFSHTDLRATFNDNVLLVRRQCAALAEDPSDANAAALGRTLGWFERTGQLASEVAALRALASLPNAQIVVGDSLIRRIMATQATDVSETIAISEQVQIPPSIRLQRPRTMRVRGTASTTGAVQLTLTPNERVAELALVYQGTVESTARGQTGPVTLHLSATGTAQAVKSVFIGPLGLELGETTVTPQVTSRVTGVSADSELVRRIASRRAAQAESRSQMNAEAQSTTIEQLQNRLDQRVGEAIAKIRAEYERMRSSLNEFGEVSAPLVREGATPYFDGARSSASGIELNAYARQREQFGAADSCPVQSVEGDVLVRVHVSFFNNMAETITGGKTLSDKFFMRYAKVIHAELPLPLMVHARAPRWALTMAKHRPIELRIPESNQFVFVVRIDAVEVDGVTTAAPTTAAIAYHLLQDEYGDYRLQRDGGVQLDAALPEEARSFCQEKLGAFFGPVLNGSGVVVPEGGVLGALRGLQSRGVHAEREWIVAGWDVPSEVVEELIRIQQGNDSL